MSEPTTAELISQLRWSDVSAVEVAEAAADRLAELEAENAELRSLIRDGGSYDALQAERALADELAEALNACHWEPGSMQEAAWEKWLEARP